MVALDHAARRGSRPRSRRCHSGRVSTSSAPRSAAAAASVGSRRCSRATRRVEQVVDPWGSSQLAATRSRHRARASVCTCSSNALVTLGRRTPSPRAEESTRAGSSPGGPTGSRRGARGRRRTRVRYRPSVSAPWSGNGSTPECAEVSCNVPSTHVQHSGRAAVVVQLHALERVPTDQPHVEVVVGHDVARTSARRLGARRVRATAHARSRAHRRQRAGGGCDAASRHVMASGDRAVGSSDHVSSMGFDGASRSEEGDRRRPSRRAPRGAPGGVLAPRARRGGSAGACGASADATTLVERLARELAPGVVHDGPVLHGAEGTSAGNTIDKVIY